MRPKKRERTGEEDLFRARLDRIIDMKHELVQLAGRLDWDWLDGEIAPLHSDKGRLGIGRNSAQRLGRGLEQHVVHHGLVLEGDLGDRSRHGEDDVEVRDRVGGHWFRSVGVERDLT